MNSEQNRNTNNGTPIAPRNYFIPSILATVLCCPPIGIFGIINAAKVERLFASGEYQAAQEASDKAKKLTIISVIAAVVCVIIYAVCLRIFMDMIPV